MTDLPPLPPGPIAPDPPPPEGPPPPPLRLFGPGDPRSGGTSSGGALNTPTALTYNGLVEQVALLAPYLTEMAPDGVTLQGQDPNFTNLIPMMLNYAEQRIQRDMDLIATQVMRTGYALAIGSNQLGVSPSDFLVIQDVIVTMNGVPTPLTPISKPAMLTLWPASSAPAPPVNFAILGGDTPTQGLTSTIIMVGPPPDQNYGVSIVGDSRASFLAQYANTPLANTATTWISTWLPDMLVMACMIYVSAYQRDFGRQSDDPQMAQSYENQYQLLLKQANTEEFRKRFEADAWSSQMNSPVATPSRG